MLVVLAILLFAACFYDVRWRLIPNWISLAILSLGLIQQTLFSQNTPVLMTLLVALSFLILGLLVFAMGWLGAGDIKLIVALSVWFQVHQVVAFVVGFSLIGGVLAVIAILHNRIALRLGTSVINNLPYGLAISASAMWLLLTP